MTSAKTSANFIELLSKLTFGFSFGALSKRAVCFQIVMFFDVPVFISRNSAGFKRTFYLKKLIFGRKKYICLHSNSQNVSLVSLCDSFDAFTALTAFVLFNQSNHLAILKSKARIVYTLFAYQFTWGCKFEGK